MAGQQVTKDLLRARFVGKTLHQMPTPSVVLDRAKVEANCTMMLDAARRLGLGWRAHIKTHKTIELTRLQVGDNDDSPANIVVSTVLEAENILPLLKEYQENGRKVNILYSFPIYGSCVDRLSEVSAQLGPGGLTVMVDHTDQIKHLTALASKSGNRPLVFLKIDMGSHRAGVLPETPDCAALVEQLLLSETVGSSVFHGLYCHAAHSYSTRDDWAAMDHLIAEFRALQQVAGTVRRRIGSESLHPLVLSVGATPTATSLQHPDFASSSETTRSTSSTSQVQDLIRDLQASGHAVEVHAGVYPTLDLQQLSTHSRDGAFHNPSAIGITVLAEVASIYRGRGPPLASHSHHHGGDGDHTPTPPTPTDEALVNAGSLALGREPCEDRGEVKGRHYGGWGLVTPWNNSGSAPAPGPNFPAEHGGWQVGKISQEHGILRWMGTPPGPAEQQQHYGRGIQPELHVGQRVRIWPNHACIAGAGHGWYIVVDSRNRGREDEVVDVWPRWNGW